MLSLILCTALEGYSFESWGKDQVHQLFKFPRVTLIFSPLIHYFTYSCSSQHKCFSFKDYSCSRKWVSSETPTDFCMMDLGSWTPHPPIQVWNDIYLCLFSSSYSVPPWLYSCLGRKRFSKVPSTHFCGFVYFPCSITTCGIIMRPPFKQQKDPFLETWCRST